MPVPVEQRTLAGELVATHPSLEAASVAVGKVGGRGNIYKCCKGLLKKTYGFQWKFVTPEADANGEAAEAADGEQWRDFEGIRVSCRGRVERGPPGRVTRTAHTELCVKDGYHFVSVNGKTWPIHKLVMTAFGVDVPPHSRIIFKDGNPQNPRLDNLEVKRPAAKGETLQRRPVIQYSHDGTMVLNRFGGVLEAARTLRAAGVKISATDISKCGRGDRDRAGGFRWRYADDAGDSNGSTPRARAAPVPAMPR
jgi:hypothetical protein